MKKKYQNTIAGNISVTGQSGITHNEIPTTHDGLNVQIEGLKPLIDSSKSPGMNHIYAERLHILYAQKSKVRR